LERLPQYDIDEKAIEQINKNIVPLVPKATVFEANLLFIDSYHNYITLKQELQKHHYVQKMF
jgi:hypothetical protein